MVDGHKNFLGTTFFIIPQIYLRKRSVLAANKAEPSTFPYEKEGDLFNNRSGCWLERTQTSLGRVGGIFPHSLEIWFALKNNVFHEIQLYSGAQFHPQVYNQ